MFILNQTNSIANNFLADLRDIDKQGSKPFFRHNVKRLGNLLAYELSKDLNYETSSLETPLSKMNTEVMVENPVIVSVLRAASPFADGFLEIFENAEMGFIGAMRTGGEGTEIDVDLDYVAAPDIEGKTVIMVDPMLATGKSLVKSINALFKNGKPKALHIASIIAAPEGVDYLKANLSLNYKIWTCALDEKLNDKSYIVPGLGDAGDLAFGPKL